MADYIAPLDLQQIFLNIFAGSQEVFLAIFLLGISVLAGIFRMPGVIFLIMVALAGILLYAWLGGGLYILIIVVAGMIIFSIVSRLVKR